MPLIATRGAASVQGFGEFAQTTAPVYIEDVFSTYLWTGNDTSQSINNGIDLSTKGGLVWIKMRSGATSHILSDTSRGTGKFLSSNTTDAQGTDAQDVTAFNTTGFTVGNNTRVNNSSFTYAGWTFREQPKFFDIVTYTGTGSARSVSHNLGSTPGCIIIKCTSNADQWIVYHRSTGTSKFLYLNTTGAEQTYSWISSVGSTSFTLNDDSSLYNANGRTYVAYLFAHDAGGFGLTGSDNVISCGSYTTDGSGKATINLGYEPQWLLVKGSSFASNWFIVDTMRGLNATSLIQPLYANSSVAEDTDNTIGITSTGFTATTGSSLTFIYIAIRRGPMKTPTSGTSVFIPVTYAGNGSTTAGQLVTSNFPVDMGINRYNIAGSGDWDLVDRLRGLTSIGVSPNSRYLNPPSTAAEGLGGYIFDATNTSVDNYGFSASFTQLNYLFQRAPGFFDVVCYTGDAAATNNQNHNLGVTPEMLIFKSRNNADNWAVFFPVQDTFIRLNSTSGKLNGSSLPSAVTSTTFNVGNTTGYSSVASVNISGYTYVTYLFASVAGVSKIGSYTGTGALQTINCGFTNGSRFVLIKRTDSTGDWWVYDSARGISSGNDPYLFLNSNAAGVTNTNYVDTTSVGFQVTAAAPAGLNANGGTYIFLAIA